MFINGIEEMGSSIQQYCLRWNNHRSNLLLVFEHLFQNEAFTDVTLACDGSSIKCHKMVLAACSSYFQQLFMENDCRHPIVILKDIRFSEIKAILEYMYKGEVNVAQDQLAGLLKAAETLKVKGLVEDNQSVSGTPTPPHQPVYPQPPHSTPDFHPVPYTKSNCIPAKFIPTEGMYEGHYNTGSISERNALPFPLWNSSKFVSPSPKSSSSGNGSTTTNNNANVSTTNPTIPANSNSYENSQSEPVPLKKKKFQIANKDTPILRTVLGHTSLQANVETQPKNLNYSISSNTSNGPTEHNENIRVESPEHFMDDSGRSVDSDKVQDDNHSFNLDADDKHGIATYVPTQKPEWKRYKQYTRNDIMAAIEAVRAGMSALQAARKYGVPSRTLYDKVKKLGITTNRPYRKGSFPMSPYQGISMKTDDTSSFSPEEQPLDISGSGNGHGNISGNGNELDSDKMDSDPGSSIKQEHSPPLVDEKDDSNHLHDEHNGSENCSSTSPRDRDPSENDEGRLVSD
ncbi:unnamed protein product [Allacma fusca]|uniref:Uncharacterized protein n=1 Tax=Allacma fusca TaxID=39272 RepID=A0A8J2NSU9_9HEXA|nr:unnamed protein product [Allacma fusca]